MSVELYQILADYSDDLANVKRRGGKLPADAAVARIEQWGLDQRVDELERAYYGKNGYRGGVHVVRVSYIKDRLKALRKEKG